MKKLEANISEFAESVAALGNQNIWGSSLSYLQQRILADREHKKPIAEAPNFLAWLLLSGEYIAYRLRWIAYLRSRLEKPNTFNASYKTLLAALSSDLTLESEAQLRFIFTARHIIIHKGFPNLHSIPTQGKDEEFVRQVHQTIRDPRNYKIIEEKLSNLLCSISKAEGSFEIKI